MIFIVKLQLNEQNDSVADQFIFDRTVTSYFVCTQIIGMIGCRDLCCCRVHVVSSTCTSRWSLSSIDARSPVVPLHPTVTSVESTNRWCMYTAPHRPSCSRECMSSR
jgi:hypothetical protein